MTPEDQITIIKACKAISTLNETVSINTLLNPVNGFENITSVTQNMKYKLSVIEKILNKPEYKNI